MLGGLTVLFFLPAAISTAHAGLAEIFFCMTVAIALFTSPRWIEGTRSRRRRGRSRRRDAPPRGDHDHRPRVRPDPRRRDDAAHRRRAGDSRLPADVRPPLADALGSEDRDPLRAPRRRARRDVRGDDHRVHPVARQQRTPAAHAFTRPAALLLALVAVQVTLGALTILSRRDMWINSLHVVCGALVLTTSLVLTLRTWRVRFSEANDDVRLKPDTTLGRQAGRGGRPHNRSARVKDGRTAVADDVRHESTLWRTVGDYVALTKPRLNVLVVATSAAGYYLGASGPLNLPPYGGCRGGYGARGRRRRRAQPGLRARYRRADAADADAASARRPRLGGRRPHRSACSCRPRASRCSGCW